MFGLILVQLQITSVKKFTAQDPRESVDFWAYFDKAVNYHCKRFYSTSPRESVDSWAYFAKAVNYHC